MNTDKYSLISVDFNPFEDGEIEQVIPAIEPQQEIWLACVIGGDEANCAYNESISVRLAGNVNVLAIQYAIRELVKRRDALRYSFSSDGEHVYIGKDVEILLDYYDLSPISQPEQDAKLTQYGHEDACKPFNLNKGPLIRFMLFKLGETDFLLRITAHHIICDGWSFGLILEDLAQYYNASAQGISITPDRPYSMKEYALNMQNFLAGEAYDKTEKYWLKKFESQIPVVELPLDYRRPAKRTYQGSRIDQSLSPQLVKDIKNLGKRSGCSLVNTLLSTFEIFIHKITGQQGIIVGLPTAGQVASECYDLVGHCVNFLPIYTQIDSKNTFSDYLKRRKSELLMDYEYQQITFGTLIKKLKIQRNAGQTPLVSIVFNVDMGMDSNVSFQGLQHTLISNPREYENFDLFLNVTGSEESLILEWSYNQDILKATTIHAWMEQFITLVASITKHPDSKIGDLALMTPTSTVSDNNHKTVGNDNQPDDLSIFEKTISNLPGIGKAIVIEKQEPTFHRVIYFHPTASEKNIENISWKEKWNHLYDLAATGVDQTDKNVDLAVAQQLGSDDDTIIYQADEWLKQSVERILTLSPKRIMEIGCGAGQFVFELADKVNTYLATDYTAGAISALDKKLEKHFSTLVNVKTFVADANDFTFVPPKSLDFVLIHSVCQYFPNEHYFFNVIKQAAAHIDSGYIFIGDVQGKSTLPIHHAADHFVRSSDKTKLRDFKRIVQNRLKLEEELTVDPGYFYLLQKSIPEITAVDVQLRKGEYINETTKYHYDVWLHVNTQSAVAAPQLIYEWQPEANLADVLRSNRDKIIGVSGIPDMRTFKDLLLQKYLSETDDDETIAQIKEKMLQFEENGVHPHFLWDIGKENGFHTHVRWSLDGSNGKLEAIFLPEHMRNVIPNAPMGINLSNASKEEFITSPLRKEAYYDEEVLKNWEDTLRQALGQSYVPSAWIPVDEFPFHEDGTIDKDHLITEFSVPLEKLKAIDEAWNGNNNLQDSPLEDVPITTTLTALINDSLAFHSDSIALSFQNQSLTYRELEKRSNQFAHFLSNKGVLPGGRIGLSVYRGFDLITAILATLKLGATYVPLDITFPFQRLKAVLDQADLNCVIFNNHFSNNFKESDLIKVCLEDIPNLEKMPSRTPDVNIPDSTLAYILHTSGSTGTPKGVAMGQRAMVNLLTWQRADSDATKGTKTLQFSPITFDVSFQEIFSTLTTGGILCLIDEEMRYDIPRLLRHIESENINRIFMPFVALQAIAENACASELFPHSIQEVITAGEQLKVTDHIVNFFSKIPHASLSNHYGPTETHVVTALKLKGDAHAWPTLPSIGKPIYNTNILILDEELKPVKKGEVGELCVSGAALAQGYLGTNKLTNDSFIDLPTEKISLRIYRTGDLAKYGADGNITFLGRGDAQVKIRGYRVELGEIEASVNKLSGVKETVVSLTEDSAGTKRLIAYVLLKGKSNDMLPSTPSLLKDKFSAKQLKEWKQQLAVSLPDYMIPYDFFAISHFPLTRSGKIDRKALPKPEAYSVDEKSNDFIAPRNATEAFITDVWKKVLGLDNISVNSDFFELGGYSLIAVKVMLAIEKETGKRFPLSSLFENSTIEKLAKLVQNDTDDIQRKRLIPIKPTGSKPPLYIIHGAGLEVIVFQGLVEFMDPEQPIYGLKARGIDGEEEPSESIEEVVEDYVSEILQHNPEGPFAIAGYSSGGIVAFEMTQLLQKRGKEVFFLGLIDSYAFHNVRQVLDSTPAYISYLLRKWLYMAILLFKNPKLYIEDKYFYIRGILYGAYKKIFPNAQLFDEAPEYLIRAKAIHLEAHKKHKIKACDCHAYLFRAENKTVYTPNFESNAWKPFLLGGLTIHKIPGHHLSVFQLPAVRVLGEKLQVCIDESQQNHDKKERNLNGKPSANSSVDHMSSL